MDRISVEFHRIITPNTHKMVNVRNTFSCIFQCGIVLFDRIFSPLKDFIADKQFNICFLSLIITFLSVFPPLGTLGYVCMTLDGYTLIEAFRRHQLIQWQSAVSLLSIFLTVSGMFFSPQLATAIGVCSVILDFVMCIYSLFE